jgi:hypothetical protein
MTQNIIVYIIVAASVVYLVRWIYRFFSAAERKKTAVPEKCLSCPEFRGSCSDPDSSGCPETDNKEPLSPEDP